uniref:Uncharacterized protein n=1 Tax=Syphacia muris TaxID=451379 RepID=A0A0N5AET2_9BILA
MTAEKEEENRRAMAEAAFNEWLLRKNKLPKGPRYSPSRDQIAEHLREDERHRVFNLWLAKPWWPRKATTPMHFAVRNSFRLRRAHSVEPTFMSNSADVPPIRNLYDA